MIGICAEYTHTLSLRSDVERGWGEGGLHLQGQYDPRLQEQRENVKNLTVGAGSSVPLWQGVIWSRYKRCCFNEILPSSCSGLFVFVSTSGPPGILRFHIDFVFRNLL